MIRPGNNFNDGPDWKDVFQKGFLLAVFTLSGLGFIGLIVGLVVTAVGR